MLPRKAQVLQLSHAALLASLLFAGGACDGQGAPKAPRQGLASPGDLDGDGVANAIDDDIDGDGVANIIDDDIDGDGTDNDADATPVGDVAEGQQGAWGDIDGDGIPNATDSDDNGDGVPDGVLGDNDCDGDGIPEEENSDCDGYCLLVESGLQPCDDGAAPGTGAPDRDGDGIPDSVDTDDDGDGILDGTDDNNNGANGCDLIESGTICLDDEVDSDGDGVPDSVDTDDDNDGIPDSEDSDDDGDGIPDDDEIEGTCRTDRYTTGETLPPRILLVVDTSGSMKQDATGFNGSKWDASRQAITNVVSSLDDQVAFGLMMYPNGDQCQEGSLDVEIDIGNAGTIERQLNRTEAQGGTPTAPTLQEARAELDRLVRDGGQRAVILATDGGPNCNTSLDPNTCRCVNPNSQACGGDSHNCLDDQNTVAAARQLNSAGYPVFVLGLPGTESFGDVLGALASAGGTGTPYNASSSDNLSAAVEDVAVRIGSCRFDLPAPADPADVDVSVDSAAIARDTARQTGRDLVAGDTLALFGTACTHAVAGGTVSVTRCY